MPTKGTALFPPQDSGTPKILLFRVRQCGSLFARCTGFFALWPRCSRFLLLFFFLSYHFVSCRSLLWFPSSSFLSLRCGADLQSEEVDIARTSTNNYPLLPSPLGFFLRTSHKRSDPAFSSTQYTRAFSPPSSSSLLSEQGTEQELPRASRPLP